MMLSHFLLCRTFQRAMLIMVVAEILVSDYFNSRFSQVLLERGEML